MIPDATGGTAAGPDPRYNRRFASWPNDSSGCRRTSIIASGCAATHLLEIAAHGFELVEVFATRTHFDYHSPAAIADLQQWLAEAGLALAAIHAPRRRAAGGRWSGRCSLASADPGAGTRGARIERRCTSRAGFRCGAVHTWHPGTQRTGARRRGASSVEELADRESLAYDRGRGDPERAVAPGSIVHFVEHDLEDVDVGICLDFGHAHIDGDLDRRDRDGSEHLIAVARARQPRTHRRSPGAVRRRHRLAGRDDGRAEGRLRRPVRLRDCAPGSTKETLTRSARLEHGWKSCSRTDDWRLKTED